MTGNVAAQRLAERLRALKDRSGLSFGSLAKKLHVSTSTLHRYCSGAVVPADYAPLERLARLCGATPEELLDLHRLWLRADAARPASRTAAPVPAPTGAGTESGASAPRAPGAEPEGAEPEGAEPAPAAPPVPGPAAPAASAQAPASGRRAARRRWPLAAALAAVVLLVFTAVNAATSGGPAGGPAADDPAAGPQAPPPEPLTWTARSHVWAGGCGHRYLVDRPPGEVPAPPVAQDAEPWADELGAVHGESAIVEATVRTARPAAVVVEAVHIRVEERRAPLDWPLFDMAMGCGGSLTPATFAVDLDKERPVARPVAGHDGDTGTDLPPPALPFAVTAEEPLVLRVEAVAGTCDCSWSIEVEWNSGDERGTLVIDDGGVPFRTSGGGAGAAHLFAFETGSWQPGSAHGG
ncbi:helix-turn-helix domain-containing protein [Streptomyces marincola]|uniref:helix-turn-helix domain-containing protein n=1 Tax=Streptomyces marincola TaxID=2878388 RepID=UPI001CF40FC5|nr:helix-turn-helix transcriptional regulator [Streptomyces marincola]UCM87095.1 helix-turn-helix domain-containing protein [Streptomyces marincola]